MGQDYFSCAIIGAGCAGLSLAWELLHGAYPVESLLLVDRHHPLEAPNRPYSFWSKGDLPFSPAIAHSWEKLRLRAGNWEKEAAMAPYRFHVVYGRDYTAHLLAEILADGRVTFRQGAGQPYAADWVFDSSYPDQYPAATYFMHSMAWEVRTGEDYFHPEVMTFCDFPSGVAPGAFYYVLPFTARQAIVYYVQWSGQKAMRVAEAREALGKYLDAIDYQREQEEYGVIPLFVPPVRKMNERTLAIGLRGGLVRACTGYGLIRMWQDSRNIVRSLERNGHPFELPRDLWITRLGDYAFRHLVRRHPENASVVLRRLFEHNQVPAALEFLDGNAAWAHLPLTMLRVTPWPFLFSRGL